MDCHTVKELLSAYYDQELPSETKAQVAHHLADCEECAAELAGFGQLSAMAQRLRHPLPPAHLRNRLESQLHTTQNYDATTAQSRGRQNWMRQPAVWFALSAAALVLVAIGWLGSRMSSHHGEHQMAALFGRYLDRFQTDPHAAQQILLTNYESRAMDADQAIHAVGYRPLVAEGLPAGYSLVSTHVMKMPCCTCVQCLCQRDDGTFIAIFEHDDPQPNWFGNRTTRQGVCNGVRCSVVELDDRLAATWRQGTRHLSVIGARDTEEVSQLVAWFDERYKSLAN